MRIGISCYDVPAKELQDLAVAAEQYGFDSLWLGEHVVAPIHYTSHHPTQPGNDAEHGSSDYNGKPIVDPSVDLVDPLIALAAAAACTTTIGFATGIYLLPLRHPLLAARAVATLGNVSEGRFRLGVGSGWLREEFDALGEPFVGRTGRLTESIQVLRQAWAGGAFEFHGEHYDFELVHACARPVHVPIVLGGNSEPALRRAVALADGWFSSGIPTFDQARSLRDRLAALQAEAGRTDPFPTTWRIGTPDPEVVTQYEAEGFEELLVMQYDVWVGASLEEKRASLERAATTLGLTQQRLTGASL